jgi:hypothetical protein
MNEVRKLARAAGIPDTKTDALLEMVDYVKAVKGGRAPRPGGQGCTFPDCGCHLPTVKCEKEELK